MPGCSGDYNDNGVVDAADYVLWRNNPASLENEGASPGVVDPADYTFWRSQFGKTVAGRCSTFGRGGTRTGCTCAGCSRYGWLCLSTSTILSQRI